MAVFSCDSCHHEMTTQDAHIGRAAKCPRCGQVGTVTPDPPDNEPEPPGEPAPEFRPPAFAPPQAAAPAPMAVTVDNALPLWASVIIAVAFVALAVGTVGGVALLLVSLAAATGAPQEAAAGAVFAALFIAGYIVARSIEKVTRAAVGR